MVPKKHLIVRHLLSPFTLPIIYFGSAIIIGGVLLHIPISLQKESIGWTDAFFTATSAICVTGLSVVDVGTTFSTFGQVIIMFLMELGGVGLMTYSSLIFYIWAHRISLATYFSLRNSLSVEESFNLGQFLVRIFTIVFLIELIGAGLLYWLDPVGFPPFSAVFHSISAFANCGFGLHQTSLEAWRGDWGVNLVFIALISCGCIGFSVLAEGESFLCNWRARLKDKKKKRFSWHTRLVVKTHIFLLVFGALFLLLGSGSEWIKTMSWDEVCLISLFQSATCRTAGFNTVPIDSIGMASTLLMIVLMYIGGAPGSCAGGIKTTTFRTLFAYLISEVFGDEQTIVGGAAVTRQTLRNAITLALFSTTFIVFAIYFISINGATFAIGEGKWGFLSIVFDVVSAFGTVGLSSGAIDRAGILHEWIFIVLMFVGRLGPIVFLSMMREWQEKKHYSWPEETLMIG